MESFLASIGLSVESFHILLIGFCVIIIIIAFFCICKSISATNYYNSKFVSHINDRLMFNGRIDKLFCEAVHAMAKEDMKGYSKADTKIYEYDLYDEIDPLVFRRDNLGDDFTFASDFREWVKENERASKTGDFLSILTRYIKYVEYQRGRQSKDDDYTNQLEHDIAEAINQAKEQRDNERREHDITEAINQTRANKLAAQQIDIISQATVEPSISAEPAIFAESEMPVKTSKPVEPQKSEQPAVSISSQYNKYVRDVNKQQGKGMLPMHAGMIFHETYQYIYSTIVLSHQMIYKILDVDYSSIDVPGCAVILNTYTEKYLVIKSDRIYTEIKRLIDGNISEYALTFNTDFFKGHKILARVIPCKDSGYSELDDLCNALINAYDSLAPDGYNTNRYLDW